MRRKTAHCTTQCRSNKPDNPATHLKMIEKTTRGGDQEIDALGELVRLCLAVGAAHDDAESLRVVLEQVPSNTCGQERGYTGA